MADPSTAAAPVETSAEMPVTEQQSTSVRTTTGRSGGRNGGRSGGRGYRNHNNAPSGGNQLLDSVSENFVGSENWVYLLIVSILLYHSAARGMSATKAK